MNKFNRRNSQPFVQPQFTKCAEHSELNKTTFVTRQRSLSEDVSSLEQNSHKGSIDLSSAEKLSNTRAFRKQSGNSKSSSSTDQEPPIFEHPIPIFPLTKIQEPQLLSIAQPKKITGQKLLLQHLNTMMKCDKYIRLVSSVIKTYRAYEPKTKYNAFYKELILSRRVIRWQSKYDTVIELLSKKQGIGMKIFKLMQLTGDLVDLTAFWGKLCAGSQYTGVVNQLEQVESNFYFAECFTWMCIYAYRYVAAKNKRAQTEKEQKQIKSKLLENGLKVIKYVMDVVTSYNNSSLKNHCGEVNLKISGYLTIFSSLIGMFLLWK